MRAPSIAAAYRQAMSRGQRETVRLRRYEGQGASRVAVTSSPLAAVLAEYAPSPVAGLIQQGGSRMILLAEDVAALVKEPADPEAPLPAPPAPPEPEAWFSDPPLKKTDRIVREDGSELTIDHVDTRTRRIGGSLIAYEIEVTG